VGLVTGSSGAGALHEVLEVGETSGSLSSSSPPSCILDVSDLPEQRSVFCFFSELFEGHVHEKETKGTTQNRLFL